MVRLLELLKKLLGILLYLISALIVMAVIIFLQLMVSKTVGDALH